MDLYIARHGDAGAAAEDQWRELTEEGFERTRTVYRQCARRIHQPIAAVVSSPLVRARQTAGIALEELPVGSRELIVTDELRPDSTPERLGKFLDSQAHWPILLVGHQPVIGQLLHWLTDQEHHRLGIATSSLFALNLITPARGCGTVLWQS